MAGGPQPPFRQRVDAVRARLPRLKAAGMVVTGPSNVRWLSGYTGSAGALFITRDRAVIISDFRYRTQIAEQCPGFEYFESPRGLIAGAAAVVKAEKARGVAVEGAHLTQAQFEDLRKRVGRVALSATTQEVERLRQVKNAQELVAIREAARITDAAFAYALRRLKPGVTERALGFEIEAFMFRQGSDGLAFPPIVASGPRSALPHARPTERRIRRGDLVTFDLGARVRGYCADLTRTVCVGKASAWQRQVYAAVYEAQRRALKALRGGQPGKAVDAAARAYLERCGYGLDFFGHGTGHGVGLDVHEMPGLGRFSTGRLPVGSVVTIEPGVYVAGQGGVRIEDLCRVTKTGCRVLSKAKKPRALPVV